MTVQHQLAGFLAAHRKTRAVDDIVQSAFKDPKQILTGDAGFALGHFKVMGELALQNTVIAFCFLFRAQLQAVFRDLLTGLVLAVLARHEAAAGERAFVGVAAVALQEELLVLTTALAANCACISCHCFSSFN